MIDPIADMLTRIRNAAAARHTEILVPFSRLKLALAEILAKEGYIERVEKVEMSSLASVSGRTSRRAARRDRTEMLRLYLRYDENGRARTRLLERISKPSRRVYISKDKIPTVLSGLGIAILSTSRGLMTNRQAKKLGVGGELICKVY